MRAGLASWGVSHGRGITKGPGLGGISIRRTTLYQKEAEKRGSGEKKLHLGPAPRSQCRGWTGAGREDAVFVSGYFGLYRL